MSESQEKIDLTTPEGVKTLMRSSKNEKEWNTNCDLVKEANNGYPEFWWPTIVASGVLHTTQSNW